MMWQPVVVDEMDVDATISSSHNRRTVNMQIDTNEPGRVIVTTEKSEGSSTFMQLLL